MADPIRASYQTPILLVGGGDIAWDVFDTIQNCNYPIIAVDAGARHLLDRNITPDLVIGDLDSFDAEKHPIQNTKIIQVPEQDTTDFEKALYSIEAPLYLAFGFWGKRLDHSLAALHVLTKYRSSKQTLLIDSVDLLFNPQGPFHLSCPIKTRISVVPFDTVAFENSKGLKYSLNGLTMKTGTAGGFSNESTQAELSIEPFLNDKDNYGVIMPNGALSSVMARLTPQL